jgi:serine/threonine-protein kinase
MTTRPEDETQAGAGAGLRAGEVLAGKYRVERVIGQGGMGVVVAAHHLQLDEKVALKFLLPQALKNEEAVARFLREARAAVKIKSEHVARVSDVGTLDNGSPYMVMEYLEGGDLSTWIEQRGAMSVEQAVDFVLQACEALAEAHSLGIVHRDLKPANLFCVMRADGQLSIKVLDFGISKILVPGAAGHDMTSTSALMGSPYYMSPEQMQMSKGVDVRTDIWALGVILYELLVGRPPFEAAAVTQLAIKVMNEPAPSLRAARPDVPPGLDLVVAKCLEKDRATRYQTVGELALALAAFGTRGARVSIDRVLGTLRKAGLSADVLPPSSMHPSDQGVAPATTAPNTAASWGQTSSEATSRSKARVGVFVAAGVGAVGLAGALFFYRTPAPSTGSGNPVPVTASHAEPPAPAPTEPPSPAPGPAPTAAVTIEPLPTALPAATTATPAATGQGRHHPAAPPAAAGTTKPPSGTPVVAATAKPNCNPPYVIDSAGDRQYKPECL